MKTFDKIIISLLIALLIYLNYQQGYENRILEKVSTRLLESLDSSEEENLCLKIDLKYKEELDYE